MLLNDNVWPHVARATQQTIFKLEILRSKEQLTSGNKAEPITRILDSDGSWIHQLSTKVDKRQEQQRNDDSLLGLEKNEELEQNLGGERRDNPSIGIDYSRVRRALWRNIIEWKPEFSHIG